MTQKLDHIAYVAQTAEDISKIQRFFGLEGADWIADDVISRVDLPTRKIYGAQNRMRLLFNYDLGNELEIVTHVSGPNLHMEEIAQGRTCFFSHHGVHLSADEEFPNERLNAAGLCFTTALTQQNWTLEHQNPRLVEKGRTYNYRYYNTEEMMGDHIEYIKRLTGED